MRTGKAGILEISRRLLVLAVAATGLVLLAGAAPENERQREKPEAAGKPEAVEPGRVPPWLGDHMSHLAGGTGRWIADNSAYKGEAEPWDRYGMEWKWGVGKRTIRGRLFALQGKQEKAEFWEYRLVWHPGEKRALLYQFGWDGTFGYGELKPSAKGRMNELEQTFYRPDGSSWKGRHESVETPDEHRTKSFTMKDGAWHESRTYVWRRG
jgi:hypothetical protein